MQIELGADYTGVLKDYKGVLKVIFVGLRGNYNDSRVALRSIRATVMGLGLIWTALISRMALRSIRATVMDLGLI